MNFKYFRYACCLSVLAQVAIILPTANAQTHTDTHGLDPNEDPSVQYVEPFRIFDNLSYVGMEWVSAYVLETSEGLILIDSLYGEHVGHLLNSMRKLGFDPADIKAVLCTHGHYDHMGGAAEIQRWTGCQVGMTPKDWLMVERGETHGDPSGLQRDLVLRDGETFTLGDTSIKCFVTPGHTPGVLSMEITVYDNGKPHKAFVFGGVGLNFEGVERTEMYIASVKRLQAMRGLEVNITNHAVMGNIFERAEQLKSRKPGDPHPFVDPDEFEDFLKFRLSEGRKKLKEEKLKAGQ